MSASRSGKARASPAGDLWHKITGQTRLMTSECVQQDMKKGRGLFGQVWVGCAHDLGVPAVLGRSLKRPKLAQHYRAPPSNSSRRVPRAACKSTLAYQLLSATCSVSPSLLSATAYTRLSG